MDALEVADVYLAAIGQQFPGWHAWRGVGGLFYAQRRDSPPETIRTRRLGHLLIRVAVRDAEIRARSAAPPHP